MKIFFSICIILISSVLHGQNKISGKVLNKSTNQPIEGVSVYISNTTIYTSSNRDGSFTLENIPNSNYEVIFSIVGYQNFVQLSNSIKNNNTYYITPKDNNLDNIIVQSYDKNGWEKYGKLFLECFIGTLPFSFECTIDNYKDLRFKFHKKENELVVTAIQPLTIKNRYLGYNIRYEMIEFVYNFSSKMLFFAGYPSFQNMDAKKGKMERYLKRRKEVYYGSQMHFMRAVYSNTAIKDGFQMHHMKDVPNYEKYRVQNILEANRRKVISNTGNIEYIDNIEAVYPRDSVNYFKHIMRQGDVITIMTKTPLRMDQVVIDNDSTSKSLIFKDHLLVEYLPKQEDPSYYTNKISVTSDSCITSTINELPEGKTLIFKNGVYFPVTNIVNTKYWAWSEKISSLLPFDYNP